MTVSKQQARENGYTKGVMWERSYDRLKKTITYRHMVESGVDFVVVELSGRRVEIFRKDDYPKGMGY